MTLEEAIKHAEEVAKDRNETANLTPTEYEDYINSCRECAEEHEQLAEWLKDYKRLLEEKPQGKWEKIGEYGLAYKCNKCGEVEVSPKYFCPNCSARMKQD